MARTFLTTVLNNTRKMTMRDLILRLMAAIETPDDLSDDDVIFLLEDAHVFIEGLDDE